MKINVARGSCSSLTHFFGDLLGVITSSPNLIPRSTLKQLLQKIFMHIYYSLDLMYKGFFRMLMHFDILGFPFHWFIGKFLELYPPYLESDIPYIV